MNKKKAVLYHHGNLYIYFNTLLFLDYFPFLFLSDERNEGEQ